MGERAEPQSALSLALSRKRERELIRKPPDLLCSAHESQRNPT